MNKAALSAIETLLESDEVDLPLGRMITGRLFDIAAHYCDGEGGCHGIDHSERVHRLSLYLGKNTGARLDILSAAAIHHDIGRLEEMKSRGDTCHAEIGAAMARDILKGLDFNTDDIGRITYCIQTHRYRNGNIKPETQEAKTLFDADKLDSIGAIGIGRAFLFAGQVGARLHNSHIDLEHTRSYTYEDTAYREFKVKLCRVKDKMLTPIGRQLALERHEFMELFFKRLDKEIYGDQKDVKKR